MRIRGIPTQVGGNDQGEERERYPPEVLHHRVGAVQGVLVCVVGNHPRERGELEDFQRAAGGMAEALQQEHRHMLTSRRVRRRDRREERRDRPRGRDDVDTPSAYAVLTERPATCCAAVRPKTAPRRTDVAPV
jgi:hypothetical protein